MLPFPLMRKLRVHMSQMTFQWLCIVVMAGVIIWLVYGAKQAAHNAGGTEVRSTATRDDTIDRPIGKPETPSPNKNPKPQESLGRESAPVSAASVTPIPEVRGVQAPAPQPVPVPVTESAAQDVQQKPRPASSEPQPAPAPVVASSNGLGKESGSVAVKKFVRPDDGVYRGKVVRCEGAGGAGPWSGWSNAGTLCLDVGDSFIKVKFDGQVWVTEPGGDRRWKPTQLEVNDLIRATINDGTMIRAEILSNVRD